MGIQKINDDEQTCAIDFSKTCFETAVTDLLKLVFKASNEIMNTEVAIDGLDDLSKLQYGTELTQKFNNTTSGKPDEYLQKIFKSDKNCKIEKIGEAFEDDVNDDYAVNCFKNHTLELLAPIDQYISVDDDTFPKGISLCQRMDDMMRSCLYSETTCISKREMMMIRSVSLKIYRIVMDAALKIKTHFGTLQEMRAKIKNTELKYGSVSTRLSSVLQPSFFSETDGERVDEVIDSILDDYKDDSCKRKMDALAKESNSNRINPTFILIGLLISLSLFYQVV